MDQEDIQQQIAARLAELPADVQAAVGSSDFDEKIQAIAKAHSLHIDQTEALADEVMLVMLGFAPMDTLARGIQEQVHVPTEHAQAIATAVSNDIFISIRESMKAWAAGKKPAEEASAPAAVAVPAPMPVSTPMITMSSSAKPATPLAAPVTPAPAPLVPKPAPAHDLMAAEIMLTEKKVAPAPAATEPKPQNYKADPYREPTD